MKIIFSALIFVAVAAHADAKKRCYPVPTPVVDPPPITPECKKHEVYSECGANGCQATCENPTLPQVCRAVCTAGCICEEGYLRDSNGKCILAKKCPQINDPPVPVCKKEHESYSTCGTACPLTCEKPTPGICTKQCVMGCFCDAGYVRDNKGNCVLVEDCPKPTPVCKKAHESYSTCGTACPLTCEKPIPGNCIKMCMKGCFCDAGYVRDNKSNCVLVEDCPKPKCGKNENYNDCGDNPCQATCENPDLPTMCKAACRPGCGCNEGYVRDNDGKCILLKKCPQIPVCKKAHESYSTCGTACPLTCEKPTPGICTEQCVMGCFCDAGFVRNNKGNCVLVEDCPKPIDPPQECTGAHESYSECNAYCPRTCGLPTPCARPPQDCNPGCVCDEGYIRATHGGKCIVPKKCPADKVDPPVDDNTCPGAHEIHNDCGTACPLTCENVNNPPMFCTANCVVGCFCEDGYVRNSNGSCVLPKKCPKDSPPPQKCTEAHESYSECNAHCQRTCGPATACEAPLQDCNPGCVCDAGYVRASHGGKCILSKKCPK